MESDSFRLLLEEDVDEFRKFRRPTRPQYSLVSSLDAIQTLRRDMLGLLDKKDQERPVFAERSLQPAGRLSDLPSHAIMDRGCLVGLWEYDMETQTIAYSCFGSVDKALTKEIKKTETYVREQLGDARSFSLDSPTSRAPRIQALRAATS